MSKPLYCQLCHRYVEPRRAIGAGTVLLCLFTLGWWLLAIPFYEKRCPICKSKAVHDPSRPYVPQANPLAPPNPADRLKKGAVVFAIALVIVVLIVLGQNGLLK